MVHYDDLTELQADPVSMKKWTMWNDECLFFGTDTVVIDRTGLDWKFRSSLFKDRLLYVTI
ncbi:MAG: hypothetical protein ACUBOA_08050 [Candidatus Loosdrechtia sp.]|uniref:hypothetical protein n=1 Tax=Candidatus Loosdrechtia sp. TaxID=3101272 RepID=UPI003A6E3718|nr:MAG: hypothetical protein QY305_06425 [Candidatus Jettenia sp. AMX2]